MKPRNRNPDAHVLSPVFGALIFGIGVAGASAGYSASEAVVHGSRSPDAVEIFVVDDGTTTTGDKTDLSLPALLARNLSQTMSRPVRVTHLPGRGANSATHFSFVLEQTESKTPAAVLFLGIADDRNLNDPRRPFLPRTEDHAAANDGEAIEKHPWKAVPFFLIPGVGASSEIWKLEGPETATAYASDLGAQHFEWAGDTLRVESDRSTYRYQLFSPKLEVVKDEVYQLRYDVDVVRGGVSVGVVDTEAKAWIISKPVIHHVRGVATASFKAPSSSVRVIVSNNNETPSVSTFGINFIRLKGPRPEPAPENRGTKLLSLVDDPEAWQPGTDKTKIERRADGVRILSDRSKFHYQLVSPSIETETGARYAVESLIDMEKGALSVGILDEAADSWIVSEAHTARRIAFEAQSNRTRVIVSNNNAEPEQSIGLIRELQVREVRKNAKATSLTPNLGKPKPPHPIYRFEDERVLAFSKANIRRVVSKLRDAGIPMVLGATWWRDMLAPIEARRRRLAESAPNFIHSVRQERLVATAYDALLADTAREFGVAFTWEPARTASAEALAGVLTERLHRALTARK